MNATERLKHLSGIKPLPIYDGYRECITSGQRVMPDLGAQREGASPEAARGFASEMQQFMADTGVTEEQWNAEVERDDEDENLRN